VTTENTRTRIPESHDDLLESKAIAHVATVGSRGEPQNNPVWFDNPFRYLEIRGVVERIVLFVGPEHTTKMGS
jgi:hypothetical protein